MEFFISNYYNLIIIIENSSLNSDNIFFSLNPHKDTELDSIHLQIRKHHVWASIKSQV